MLKPRYYLLDELRGLAVVAMVVYHSFYLLADVFGSETGRMLVNCTRPVQPFIAGTFFVICGICARLSRSNWKRGLRLLGLALLLIHHLRKMKDDDPLNMVSGTTGLTGSADSVFVLARDKRGGSHATLCCSGRDIEDRELRLAFDARTHLWTLESDSVETPRLDVSLHLVCDCLRSIRHFTGTASELAARLQTDETIVPSVLAKKLLQSRDELAALGVKYRSRRSNGKRVLDLTWMSDGSDGSDGKNDIPPYVQTAVPADPAGTATPGLQS